MREVGSSSLSGSRSGVPESYSAAAHRHRIEKQSREIRGLYPPSLSRDVVSQRRIEKQVVAMREVRLLSFGARMCVFVVSRSSMPRREMYFSLFTSKSRHPSLYREVRRRNARRTPPHTHTTTPRRFMEK